MNAATADAVNPSIVNWPASEYSRNAKMPFTAAEFRYRYPSDWIGLVSLAPQFGYQAIQFFHQA